MLSFVMPKTHTVHKIIIWLCQFLLYLKGNKHQIIICCRCKCCYYDDNEIDDVINKTDRLVFLLYLLYQFTTSFTFKIKNQLLSPFGHAFFLIIKGIGTKLFENRTVNYCLYNYDYYYADFPRLYKLAIMDVAADFEFQPILSQD